MCPCCQGGSRYKREMWRWRDVSDGMEGGAELSGERELWGSLIRCMWMRREKESAIVWQKGRDIMCCCGKGHQSPLWGWVVFEPHFCGYNVYPLCLYVCVCVCLCNYACFFGKGDRPVLSLIVCNKELTPLGSIGVLSIIWETAKQNTQSYAQTGTHTKTSMHVTHGTARNVSRSV